MEICADPRLNRASITNDIIKSFCNGETIANLNDLFRWRHDLVGFFAGYAPFAQADIGGTTKTAADTARPKINN